jgi:hypothetical protein
MTGQGGEPWVGQQTEDHLDLHRLGPPGWDDFAAARRRFEATLAVQGLERTWAAPAVERGRAAGGAPR